MPTPIKHLVVLMLESRSFDHMLGFMKRDNPAIDGLNGDEWNYPAREGHPNVVVSRNAGYVPDLNPSPHNDFSEVTQQIFSSSDPTKTADMRGFVRNYFSVNRNSERAGNVMKCFTPETLPILSTLAKQYAVCDRWFSSVPGPTIPNRLFVHGASSVGSVNQDAVTAPFALHTIFESFTDQTPYDYRIYTNGPSILLANKFLMLNQHKFFDYATSFEDDATRGNLPAYTFIEPRFDDDGHGSFANSQSPDFPVDRGEATISEIYSVLTKSPGWKSTLFLIIYSQHGGIFDHVAPPTVTRQASSAGLLDVPPSKDPQFDFTRLGVRVPAVFVSPCIAPGTVLHDRDYEHSSVVATVRKLFCKGSQPLNWREAQANTFDDVLALEGDAIREDVVALPEPVVGFSRPSSGVRSPTDLSVLMAQAMQYSLLQRGIFPPDDVGTLTNAADVTNFLQEAQKLSKQLGITIGPSTHVARDSWTTDDTLGHFYYSYAIYRFLTNSETKSPLAVSIQAPWGGGKTSLMRMIQEQLDPNALERIDQTKVTAASDNRNASVKRILDELKAAARSSASDLPISTPTQPSIPPIGDQGQKRVTIWFNAWKYENTAQVWAGLADCIVQEIGGRMGPVEREIFWFKLQFRRLDARKIRHRIHEEIFSAFVGKMFSWFPVYFLGCLVVLGLAIFKHTWIAGSLCATEFSAVCLQLLQAKLDTEKQPARISLGDFVQAPDYAANLGFVHEVVEDLRHVFQSISEKYLPMVVFIDDLDRCSPGKIAAVIEAINLFLAGEFPDCMFVLGIDDEMVAAALDMAHGDVIAKLPSYARSTSIGWRFMDKFVQLPIVIPRSPQESLTRYVESLLFEGGSHSDVSMKALDAAARIIETSTPSSTTPDQVAKQVSGELSLTTEERVMLEREAKVIQDMDESIKEFTDQDKGIRDTISKHALLYFNNPRDTKRFVNLFRFYYFIRTARESSGQSVPSMDQLCRGIALSLRWPEVARWLRGQPTPQHASSESALKALERLGGTSQTLAEWQDGMNISFGLGLSQSGWLSDEDLRAFLKREFLDFKEEERLSSCAGWGLW